MPKVFSTWLLALSMLTMRFGFHVRPCLIATLLAIETICDPLSSKHSSCPTLFTTKYIERIGALSSATKSSPGSPSFTCRRYCKTGSCNVPLHHRSGPRLKPFPRYPQPAPRAKLSVRLSTSHYIIVPFFPIVIYVSHYVTVSIVSIIPRFYCTRPIVFS